MKQLIKSPAQLLTAILLILSIQGFVLWLLGQPLFCDCGYIKLWEGVVLSSGNSQHLIDWYSFSHILHGMLFYLIAWLLFPNSAISSRFLIALCVEASWEMIENTPWVIEHYRQQALAVGYSGDTVLNSLSDSIFMIVGFVISYRFPWWLTFLLAISLELWLAYEIRDNFTLNIINLIYPTQAINAWQLQL